MRFRIYGVGFVGEGEEVVGEVGVEGEVEDEFWREDSSLLNHSCSWAAR